MITRTLAGITAAAFVILQGCAVTPGTAAHPYQQAATTIPAADPALDHFIAWIPRKKAQTATVAKALTHISLGHARELTTAELCDGAHVISGKVIASIGPLPALAPVNAGGYPAWYYRVSQLPGSQGCAGTGNPGFYQELQTNLPDWINIRLADSKPGTVPDLSR
jgi:hypothetical protein